MINETAIVNLMRRICQEEGLGINAIGIAKIAHHLTESLNQEHLIEKKLSNIALVRGTLDRQFKELREEEEKLREECPHLNTVGMETVDGMEYHCATCKATV